MHIAEGILPMKWAVLWYMIMLPFLGYGIWRHKHH
ncbi:energy-coupling factor ABC transporter permease, partial [Nitrospirota bacterium]